MYINGSRDCVDGSQLAGHDDIHTYGDDVHALVTDFLCLPIWWVKDFVLWLISGVADPNYIVKCQFISGLNKLCSNKL